MDGNKSAPDTSERVTIAIKDTGPCLHYFRGYYDALQDAAWILAGFLGIVLLSMVVKRVAK